MHYTVIQEFEGKEVEVYTTAGRDFSGTIKYDLHKSVVIVHPVRENVIKRFGPAVIDVRAVVSIREIKPREAKLHIGNDDCDDDCDHESEG
jgi:hypothetical protein